MIYNNNFYGCCGINVLWGLGKTSTANVANYNAVASVIAEIEKNKTSSNAMTLIALNEEQRAIYQEGLGDIGYYPVVMDAYHPGHKTKITLFARINNPVETHGTSNDTKKRTPAHRSKTSRII